MKLIIDIDEEDYHFCKMQAAVGITNPLKICIANGTPIPDNATNVLDAIKLEIKQEYDNQGDWSFNDGLAYT